MKADWHFRPMIKGETNVDSISDEFFASDVISDPGRALVREGIQNSLDAAKDGEKVRIRILLSDGDNTRSKRFSNLFMSAWIHFQNTKSGLREETIPAQDENCRYLAFEDFGTRGLEGDVEEAFEPPRGANHFYYFFRAEGQSDKKDTELGSWGVGKQVFARASRIRSMIGVTVQSSTSSKYMMGRALLKIHPINGNRFQDGYYGTRQNEDDPNNQLMLPTDDEEYINEFCQEIGLDRLNQPGLSVVVPWIEGDITGPAILRAVLKDFFYPILTDQLEVKIDVPGSSCLLSKETFFKQLPALDSEVNDILKLAELAKWSINLREDDHTSLEMLNPHRGWQWNKSLFRSEVLNDLIKRYKDGERIALLIPVTIRLKNGKAQSSYFYIYFQRDETDSYGHPFFIRGGLIISNEKGKRSLGTRALVVITEPSLVSFVRDAENPSHTEWRSDSTNFKGKYSSGAGDLDFIRHSVSAVIGILAEQEVEADPRLLVDFFSIPEKEESVETTRTTEGDKKGDISHPPPTPPPPPPAVFRIEKVSGGFSLAPGKKSLSPPLVLHVYIAYDIRRGNALKRYNPNDFTVDTAPVSVARSTAVNIIESNGNHFKLQINKPNFHFKVTGFDQNRDLYIKVIPEVS